MTLQTVILLSVVATVSVCLVCGNHTAAVASEQLGLADSVRDASKIQMGTEKYIVGVLTLSCSFCLLGSYPLIEEASQSQVKIKQQLAKKTAPPVGIAPSQTRGHYIIATPERALTCSRAKRHDGVSLHVHMGAHVGCLFKVCGLHGVDL